MTTLPEQLEMQQPMKMLPEMLRVPERMHRLSRLSKMRILHLQAESEHRRPLISETRNPLLQRVSRPRESGTGGGFLS